MPYAVFTGLTGWTEGHAASADGPSRWRFEVKDVMWQPVHSATGAVEGTTNAVVAEYAGIVALLRWYLETQTSQPLRIRTGFKMIAQQVNKQWRAYGDHRQGCEAVKALLPRDGSVQVVWSHRSRAKIVAGTYQS